MATNLKYIIILSILFIFPTNCRFLNSQYVGHLFVFQDDSQKIGSISSNDFYELKIELRVIAEEFGFKEIEDMTSENQLVFDKNRENVPGEYRGIPGSKANLSIGIFNLHRFVITIRDTDNSSETDFVRMIKSAIISKLDHRFGIEKIKFVESEPFILNN